MCSSLELVLIVIMTNILAILNMRLLGIKQGISILMIIFNILGFLIYFIKYDFSFNLLITNSTFAA